MWTQYIKQTNTHNVRNGDGGSFDCCYCKKMKLHHYTTQHHRLYDQFLLLLSVIVHNHVDRPNGASIVFSIRQWCVVVHIRVQWMIFSFSFFNCCSLETRKGSNFPFIFLSFLHSSNRFLFSHSLNLYYILYSKFIVRIQPSIDYFSSIFSKRKWCYEHLKIFFLLNWRHWNGMNFSRHGCLLQQKEF